MGCFHQNCIEYLSTLRGGDVLSEEDAMWAIQKADMGVALGSSMWRNSFLKQLCECPEGQRAAVGQQCACELAVVGRGGCLS